MLLLGSQATLGGEQAATDLAAACKVRSTLHKDLYCAFRKKSLLFILQ